MAFLKHFLVFLSFCSAMAINIEDRINFLKDFVILEERSSTIVSHLKLTKNEHVRLCKALSSSNVQFKLSVDTASDRDDVIHLADCKNEYTWDLLHKAIQNETIRSPARWLLFLEDTNDLSDDYKFTIEQHNLFIDLNTEVFIALQLKHDVKLFSVYKTKSSDPLVWEELGAWSRSEGFGNSRVAPTPVGARRRDLGRAAVVAAAVVLHNRTMEHMPDYLHREVDTLTKLMYYMTTHLVEWVNGSMVLNRTASWGYRQPDGRYDGVVREMQDGRADLSGTVMIPTKERLNYMNFVLAPAPVEAMFIFRKPALASVTNIYVLPFSIGVWTSIMLLICVSSLTLFLVYFREATINPRYNMSYFQRASEGLFETLCLVFQQGTAYDPLSIAGTHLSKI